MHAKQQHRLSSLASATRPKTMEVGRSLVRFLALCFACYCAWARCYVLVFIFAVCMGLHATVRGCAATFSFAWARWFGVVAAIFFCVRCLGALVWRRGAHFFRRFKLARLLPRQFFSLRARVRWPPLLKSEDHLNAWSRTRTT